MSSIYPAISFPTMSLVSLLGIESVIQSTFPWQVAYADVVEAVKDADILLFILPHQFVERTCNAIKSHVKKNAFAVSFSKVGRARFFFAERRHCSKGFLCE
jgi:hypothetical protein